MHHSSAKTGGVELLLGQHEQNGDPEMKKTNVSSPPRQKKKRKRAKITPTERSETCHGRWFHHLMKVFKKKNQSSAGWGEFQAQLSSFITDLFTLSQHGLRKSLVLDQPPNLPPRAMNLLSTNKYHDNRWLILFVGHELGFLNILDWTYNWKGQFSTWTMILSLKEHQTPRQPLKGTANLVTITNFPGKK